MNVERLQIFIRIFWNSMRNDADVIPFYRIETEDIYAWGNNQYGRLGLGEEGSEESIFEVKLPS